jgi:intracellular sulfur oxidation DsrE/DsrF family protein
VTVAYFITGQQTKEIVERCLLRSLEDNRHGAKIAVMFFGGDAVRYLAAKSLTAERLSKLAKRSEFHLLACECACKRRKLDRRLYAGVKLGHLSHLYRLAAKADHIVTL